LICGGNSELEGTEADSKKCFAGRQERAEGNTGFLRSSTQGQLWDVEKKKGSGGGAVGVPTSASILRKNSAETRVHTQGKRWGEE